MFLGNLVVDTKIGGIMVLLGFLSATSLLLKASTPRIDSWFYIEKSGLHPQSSKLAFSKVSGPCAVLHSTFLGPFWATCNITMALRYKKNFFVCLFQVVLHGKTADSVIACNSSHVFALRIRFTSWGLKWEICLTLIVFRELDSTLLPSSWQGLLEQAASRDALRFLWRN